MQNGTRWGDAAKSTPLVDLQEMPERMREQDPPVFQDFKPIIIPICAEAEMRAVLDGRDTTSRLSAKVKQFQAEGFKFELYEATIATESAGC